MCVPSFLDLRRWVRLEVRIGWWTMETREMGRVELKDRAKGDKEGEGATERAKDKLDGSS
jgi:hypothetical protein